MKNEDEAKLFFDNNDSNIKEEILKGNEKKKNIISRNKMSYLLISFNIGISTLSDLAVQYFFKDYFKLEPGSMSRILSICIIPWMIKPIFGILTDFFPLFGYRRKLYLIISGILDILCWLYMAFIADSVFQAVWALLLINIGLAFSSVIGEAVVVELSQLDEISTNSESHGGENKDHKAKDLISMFFIIKDIGALASSYLKGYLVDVMSLRHIFLISAITPLLILFSGFFYLENNLSEFKNDDEKSQENKNLNKSHKSIIEERYDLKENHQNNNLIDHHQVNLKNREVITIRPNNSLLQTQSHDEQSNKLLVNNKGDTNINNKNHITYGENEYDPNSKNFSKVKLFKKLFNFICTKEISIPLFFMIIITFSPSYDDPLFYFLTNELKFSGNIMGQLSLASSITAIIAVILYKCFFKHVKFQSTMIIGSILYFFFSYCAYILTTRMNVSLGISDYILSLFSSSTLSLIGEFIGMPLLSLACIKSPKYLEGTIYAFFMSAFNIGGIISYLAGSFLTNALNITSTDFKNLPKLISICNIIGLFPLFIFLFFDNKYFEDDSSCDSNKTNYNVEEK